MSANAAPISIKSESLQRELSVKVFINPLSCYRPVSIMVQHHHLPDARYIRTVKCTHGISVRAQDLELRAISILLINKDETKC